MEQAKSQAVMWSPSEGVGLQDCRIWHLRNRKVEPIASPFGAIQPPVEAIEVSGLILGAGDDRTLRTEYNILCDMRIRYHEFHFTSDYGDNHFASPMIVTEGDGKWWNHKWKHLSELDGCTAIDIVETPFTNTLAIKQLNLKPGESGEITVAWFHLAEGTWQPDRQRYTCIEKTARGSVYQFEQLSSGFTATLPFDENDLVIDYPELFRRVYPKVSDR